VTLSKQGQQYPKEGFFNGCEGEGARNPSQQGLADAPEWFSRLTGCSIGEEGSVIGLHLEAFASMTVRHDLLFHKVVPRQ